MRRGVQQSNVEGCLLARSNRRSLPLMSDALFLRWPGVVHNRRLEVNLVPNARENHKFTIGNARNARLLISDTLRSLPQWPPCFVYTSIKATKSKTNHNPDEIAMRDTLRLHVTFGIHSMKVRFIFMLLRVSHTGFHQIFHGL